jgi:hypothetical protein
MAERFITPIKGRKPWWGGNEPTAHLLLTVEGEGADLRPDRVTFQALAPEESHDFLPSERVGWGLVTVPLLSPNQVRLNMFALVVGKEIEERYQIAPVRLVAAGVRLVHAHYARGNP